jgi:AcrR family transcriptional regulator
VPTARERARAGLVADIKAAATRELAAHGAPGLSLRAVARELGLASSALYRYFPSRDALLTALIVDAYDEVGEAAERADAVAGQAGADPGARWLAVCRAVRGWALAHPHRYALVYGSPVPGYAAPQDTVEPAVRLSRVMAGIVVTAYEAGSLRPPDRPYRGPRLVTPEVVAVVGSAPPPPYEDALERSFVLLVALTGAISYLLFGHLHLALVDDDAWFDLAMAVAAEGVGLVVPLGE